MIFAKHPNFIAQILAEALVRQNEDDKNLSSWVFDIITERCQSIKNNFTDEERAELLEKQQGQLEECKTFNNFIQKFKKAKGNSILHPQILINRLSKVQLSQLETCPLSKDKTIIHQAVLVYLIGCKFIRQGVLSLGGLIRLGFDVTVLDKKGENALSPIFGGESPGDQMGNTHMLLDMFAQSEAFVDMHIKQMSKRMSLFGRANLGPYILL